MLVGTMNHAEGELRPQLSDRIGLHISVHSIMDGVSLQGKLNSVTVTDLSLVPGAVRIQANVKGNIGLKVQELNF